MTTFSRVVWKIIDSIFLVLCVVFGFLGIYEQIMGLPNTERLLKKLHIPLSYNQVIMISFTILALMIITYVLRMKLSKKSQ